MKKKYLFIALAMGTLVSSQSVVTEVKCAKKCLKYYKEDTKGNTIHNKDCMAIVYMDDLDPCLFDKYGLAHPLFIQLDALKKENETLREIIEEQKEYLDKLITNTKR
tara:strand:- start:153 stop:473 length:321 start_codon:yes stop_codon:yes gene_type:complete